MSTIHWFVAEVDPKNAGYRVRTQPLVAEMRRQGEDVQVHALADLAQQLHAVGGNARAVIVSKPSDSLSAIGLARFAALGVPVVVDLFDNYFSWNGGVVQRQLHWQWLRALRAATLVMCSSPYLQGVLGTITDKPVLRVSDPVPLPDHGALEPAALAPRWQQPRCIELLWFGIAGNPFYQAGLEDLVRWSGVVRELVVALAGRCTVRLTVCTNRVAAVEGTLEALRADAVDARYVEWSEEGCDALMRQSHVVLLPTNLSGFGLAKTHNRCSDALVRGCCVLASPRGPYEGLGGAVFDDVHALAAHLEAATPPAVAALLQRSLQALAARQDLAAEIGDLRNAITRAGPLMRRSADPARRTRVLVIGRIKSHVPKQARAMGCLLAGFADHGPRLDHDFQLESLAAEQGRVVVGLSADALQIVERGLAADMEVDVDDHGESAVYRVQGWRVLVERGARRLTVQQGLDDTLVQRLADAQATARGVTGPHLVACVDTLVEVMTRVLWRLGLREFEMAAEFEGGWPAFAAQADPELAALAERLRAMWLRHEGREIAWGRVPATLEAAA